MLLTIQFPIADSRQFLAEETGFLASPSWNLSVNPERDFVRSFGKIETRRMGGLDNWIGEKTICFAKRAVRFPDQKALNFEYAEGESPIPLRIVFRRFFSDGYATNKFEIGIGERGNNHVKLSPDNIRKFINYCLELEVQIPQWKQSVRLVDAGSAIANLYLRSSTKKKFLEKMQISKWWVEAEKPILFFVYSDSENFAIPFGSKKTVKLNTDKYELGFCKVPWKNGKDFGMWLVKAKQDIDYKSIRELRIALLRLYAERQCVRSILRNIGKKRIVLEPKSFIDELNPDNRKSNSDKKNKSSDLFQTYWKLAYGRIGSFQRLTKDLTETILYEDDDISNVARSAEDVIEPGERREILNGLVNIRPNYKNGIDNFTYNDVNIQAEEFIMQNEEKNVDQQINLGSGSTVGAIGKGDAIMHGDINQQTVGSQIDINALLSDLTKLREELNKRKSTVEDEVAVGQVAQAEVEAKKGNESKVWEILKGTGNWVLETATDIGAKVAVEAIKKSVGI